MDPLYKFPTPLANEVLEAAKNADWCNQIRGLRLNEDRQAIWVTEELKGLFGERNAKGQTLLYCLLRFTKKDYIRNKFLYTATKEQLAMQNLECKSTALLGYFWGEHESPRMADDTPVCKVFLDKDLFAVANIPNKNEETAFLVALDNAIEHRDSASYYVLMKAKRMFQEESDQ